MTLMNVAGASLHCAAVATPLSFGRRHSKQHACKCIGPSSLRFILFKQDSFIKRSALGLIAMYNKHMNR